MAQQLDDLPTRGSKYWTRVDAEVRTHELKIRECKHEFAFNTSSEVECTKCHIGFYLMSGETLKDGHIYIGKKLVI